MLLVLVGLAVAGCGGDDDEAGTTTEARPRRRPSRVAPEADDAERERRPRLRHQPRRDRRSHRGQLHARRERPVVRAQLPSHRPGGVDVSTEVAETGEKSFDIELQAGEYTFVCDPHASQMNGSFTVG